MLWKKESKVLYENYFKKLDQSIADLDDIANESTPPAKSNRISERLRQEGNIEYESGNWSNAILAFNYALCFAEPQSDDLIHAYGNRSTCFFQLDRYNSSYNDIKMALQVPTHSDTLKQQLEQHRNDCKDFIDENMDHDSSSDSVHTPSSCLAPPNTDKNDTNVPFQWLTTELCESSQYRFRANCDIDVGQTIRTETALVSTLMNGQYMHCNVCFTKNDNLFPCDNCTAAMFCSSSCHSSILHTAECNLNNEINEDGKLKLLIRTVLYAIGLFDDIDDLVEFVIQTVSGESKPNIQPMASDGYAEYRQFLQLKSCQEIASGDRPDPLIYFAFKAIMDSKIGESFQTEKRQRFLTHLIWQHQAIISLGYVHQLTNKSNQVQSLGVFPQFSNFKHSCTPNAMYYLTGNKMIVMTLTPIKAGEEIFVSYFGKAAILTFDSNGEERKEMLRNLYKSFGMKCACSFCLKCESNPKQRKTMKNDRMYRYIGRIYTGGEDGLYKLKKSLNKKQLADAREQAIAFLRKYGRMTWCKELVKITACFMDIIWLESEPDDDLNAGTD